MTRPFGGDPTTWPNVARLLREEPPGTLLRLSPASVEHPRDAGMRPAVAFPHGQRTDYRLDIGGGHDLVVSEFASAFEARLERQWSVTDLESSLRETPGTAAIGLIGLGALIGLVLGRSKESAFAGAAIGGVAALCGIGVANAESAPAVSDAATKLLAAMKPIGQPRAAERTPIRGARRGPNRTS